MNITVVADVRAVEDRLSQLRDGGLLATARALNRTLQQVRTVATRAVAEDLGITQKAVRDGLRLQQASRGDLRASIHVSGQRIPLIQFRARQTSRGVAYRLPGGRSDAPGAFIATMKSGHRGVFRRRSRPRLPIDELRGPSLPHVFTQRRIDQAMRDTATRVFPDNLAHEIEHASRSSAADATEG